MAEQNHPLDVRKNIRAAWLKTLVVPVLVLVFFLAAPRWLNNRLHDAAAKSIRSSQALDDQEQRLATISTLDFEQVALNCPPGMEKLHENFVRNGIAANFQRLRWGLWLSIALVAGLVLSLVTVSTLNKKAGKSMGSLIQSYRLAWKISIGAALLVVFLLIPLLTYGTFEFTVLLMDRYVPKLLLLIVLGGLVALWLSAKTLLQNVPLEFKEWMAREVTPKEAPALWAKVREAADYLQTAPPDHIIIGLQLNFYVTELAVLHDGGRVEGRTLYLSYPLLKQMPEDEVLAIIGHELGHFMGNDTRMTREFYPLRLKIHGTLVAMAKSGWVGWASFQFLNYFHWCFGQTEQAASRSREFLADQRAASLTSARTAAQALVRFQVLAEAFQRNLKAALKNNLPNPLQMPLLPVVREQLAPEAAFWTQLFEQHLPHPMDSHPTLRARLEALGENITGDEAKNIALADTHSAYDRWLTSHDDIFADLTSQAEDVVSKMRQRSQIAEADINNEAGRELLARHFPEQKWRGKTSGAWASLVIIGCFLAFFVAMALVIGQAVAYFIFGGLIALLIFLVVFVWRRQRTAEITLNAEGIFSARWKRPLLFKDVEKISAQQNYSNVTLTFRLKEKHPSIAKFSLLPFARKNVSLSVNGYNEKPAAIAQKIFCYLTRQTKPEGVEPEGNQL